MTSQGVSAIRVLTPHSFGVPLPIGRGLVITPLLDAPTVLALFVT